MALHIEHLVDFFEKCASETSVIVRAKDGTESYIKKAIFEFDDQGDSVVLELE